jgi:hypothetical protein
MKDFYKILELDPNSTIDQIKSQHRFLVHAWHPDKFPISDQKAKAEEKLKEINEAYSTLIDPEKRRIYDLLSGRITEDAAGSEFIHQKAETQSYRPDEKPANNVYQNDSRNICESCGMPIETKYIEIYQNIGLLIMRRFASVKGRFCKSCIEYYFWTMTGKTMLFGWWGVISFVLTPFLLLNNFLRYLSSLSMEKPIISITPRPSPFWIFSSLGGIFLVGYVFNLIFSGGYSAPNYSPTRTSPPKSAIIPVTKPTSISVANSSFVPLKTPTRVPTVRKTPTPASECIIWNKISKSMIGKKACVYGDVYKTRNVGGSTFQVLFSDNQDAFFLAAGTFYYEVGKGDCVVAEGIIQKNTYGVPYIDIDDELFICPPGW